MTPPMPNTPAGRTARTIVWAVVALFIATLAAVVILVLFAPAGSGESIVIQVLGTLAPTLAVLAAMRQVGQVGERVDRVAEDTHALTNGLLDAKVRAATAEVLPDHLVDPDYKGQPQAADVARREAAERPQP